MPFKKFIEFLYEKKKKDDIEEVFAESPNTDPAMTLSCPKCGESGLRCGCYEDDYYNAKNPQWTPKAKKRKPKDEFKKRS